MNTKQNILIVDDDPNLRKTLADVLETKGYAPAAVATGQAALDRVAEEAPVVALIDLKLDDMSGLEVTREIKERCPDTECIVLTGYASQSSAIKAINLGAYSYVQKPYDVEQLLVTIRRAIEKRKAEVALRQYTQQLETLQVVTGALSTSLALDEVLELILEQLAAVVDYDSAAVFLIEGERMRCVICRGHSHPEQVLGQLLPADNELVQEMLTTGRPITLADAQADPRFQRWGGGDYVRGWLGVPLQARGEMIGILTVDSRQPDAYGPAQVALVQPFCDQAAQAIENARLHEQVQRHAAELEQRVRERTAELCKLVNAMTGREVRMAELKDVIRKLRAQLKDAGLTPVADDPLLAG